MLGIDDLPGALVVATGDATAQRQVAAHVRIVGVTGQQAVDGRLDHRPGGVEIRIADGQQQHIAPLLAQGQSSVMDIPGGGTFSGNPLGQG